MNEYGMVINGCIKKSVSFHKVKNPSDVNEVIGLAPIATEADLELALESAKSAFLSWREVGDETRAKACRDIAKILSDNKQELAELITAEQGKPLHGFGSLFELEACIHWANCTAEMSLSSEMLEKSEDNIIEKTHSPLGVVASITPWNWPLLLGMAHILPAIRTGNTVVMKPSPYTPLSTLRMGELINDILPDGVLNVISGSDDIGALLTTHKLVDKIVFTGSVDTGKKVMSSASQRVVPVTLELGGNDAGITLPGLDIRPIAERLFMGAMLNTGQTCAALKRLFVHEGDYDAVCDVLVEMCKKTVVGDGRLEKTTMGPLQNKAQLDKVIELVEDAKAKGARILCGGECVGGDNYFYLPTIIADAKPGMRVVDEEQFGPVLPLIKYHDLDDAIYEANNTSFGLGASVWGQNDTLLSDVANKLEAGTVYINKHSDIAPHVPFGGLKNSGLGVVFGQEGLESYTAVKVINASRSAI